MLARSGDSNRFGGVSSLSAVREALTCEGYRDLYRLRAVPSRALLHIRKSFFKRSVNIFCLSDSKVLAIGTKANGFYTLDMKNTSEKSLSTQSPVSFVTSLSTLHKHRTHVKNSGIQNMLKHVDVKETSLLN